MLKKVFIGILCMLIAGAAFAQSNEKKANSVNNWISGEASILGGGVRYERMFSEKLSIGANVYYSTLFFFWNEIEVGGSVRYYPFAGIFFIGGGLGFHVHSGIGLSSSTGVDANTVTGVAISPELGWKIDIGSVGGFFIQPGIKMPITIGMKEELLGELLLGDSKKFGVAFGVVPYFGLGFAF